MAGEQALRRLLDHLDSRPEVEDGQWHGWEIRRIGGGRNNLLYRATTMGCDMACKFTMDDGRDRAGREFNALTVLRQAGLDVAPEPIFLDRASYRQPVVVQTWLAGDGGTMPETDTDWQGVARHLAQVHSITPGTTSVDLPTCTVHARTAEQGKARVRDQVALLPDTAQPHTLRMLLGRLEAAEFPGWAESPVTLCRLDNNVDNYIQRPGAWASVDWEYSGWGDPAFDVANLVTHVSWMSVAQERWDGFVDSYCALVDDETAAMRISVYCKILVVWWAARLARYLHDIPSGRDTRLVIWPEGWREDIEAKYAHYVNLAQQIGDGNSLG
ncbi:MAG: aminoglycoside phosphotransferase family protein [Anaerolineae bacterium]|nr:aminoglycoside phosphotransferase family protein [Anaerolineae bacterium]